MSVGAIRVVAGAEGARNRNGYSSSAVWQQRKRLMVKNLRKDQEGVVSVQVVVSAGG